MECLVVLPLYFTLFGGLFFVGELMVNRLRLQVGDRVATWFGSDRFGLNADVADDFGMGYLFQEKFSGEGEIEVRIADRDDDAINHYAALFKGGITKLNIHMPGWITGCLAMQSIISGDKDMVVNEQGDAQDLDWAHQGDFRYFDGHPNNFRSWSIHRTKASDFGSDSEAYAEQRDKYNRARTTPVENQEWEGKWAVALLTDGTLINVISDKWLNNVDSEEPPPKLTSVGSSVKRVLADFGQ